MQNKGCNASSLVLHDTRSTSLAMHASPIMFTNSHTWKRRYYGHQELVTGIATLHNPKGYASCSWDTTVNIWHKHTVDEALARQHQKLLKCHEDFLNPRADKAISEFEKKFPKFIPASLNVRSIHPDRTERHCERTMLVRSPQPFVESQRRCLKACLLCRSQQ